MVDLINCDFGAAADNLFSPSTTQVDISPFWQEALLFSTSTDGNQCMELHLAGMANDFLFRFDEIVLVPNKNVKVDLWTHTKTFHPLTASFLPV